MQLRVRGTRKTLDLVGWDPRKCRNFERQVGFIRKGARFLTTQTDIGFLVAEASRVTGELRRALGGPQ